MNIFIERLSFVIRNILVLPLVSHSKLKWIVLFSCVFNIEKKITLLLYDQSIVDMHTDQFILMYGSTRIHPFTTFEIS
jgi:hypothetical protein